MSWYTAIMKALASGRSDAKVKRPPPGRTMRSTPPKPNASATQVRPSTRSCSTGPESTAMKSGAMKAMLAASASGMRESAVRKSRLEAVSTAPRRSCSLKFAVRSRPRPSRGPRNASMRSICET